MGIQNEFIKKIIRGAWQLNIFVWGVGKLYSGRGQNKKKNILYMPGGGITEKLNVTGAGGGP